MKFTNNSFRFFMLLYLITSFLSVRLLSKKHSTVEPTTKPLQQEVIQRDSGDLYHVTQLRLGSNSQKLVNLQKSNANTKMTLDADKFINALNTPGSPWKLK